MAVAARTFVRVEQDEGGDGKIERQEGGEGRFYRVKGGAKLRN